MGYLLTILARLGQMFMMGVSIHLVFSLGGIFFLGFPTIVNASAYALAISEKAGMLPSYAFIVAIMVAVIMSILFAFLFIKVSADSFAVLGLTSIVAFEAFARSCDSLTNGVLGISGIKRPESFSHLNTLGIFTLGLALGFIVFEVILLKTKLGRSLRAFKESPLTLEAIGISTRCLSFLMIVISGIIFAIGGILMIWQVQFLDPGFAGLPMLIEVLTIGILALRPQLRFLSLGTFFVVLMPEILRFLNLPTTIFGQLRILIYSFLLIILVMKFQKKLYIFQRSI